MAQLIDGNSIAAEVLEFTAASARDLKLQGIDPHLAVLLVGEDPASLSYVKKKTQTAATYGLSSELISLPSTISQQDLDNIIDELNHKESVHGILVQMPLPAHLDAERIISLIRPEKDVDGFHPLNLGQMFRSEAAEELAPCTPKGVVTILQKVVSEFRGQEVVIVGSSNLVGKPLATMLTNRGATVTVCNSKTKDLKAHTIRADIVVVAVGRPGLLTGDMVKPGVVVIDVGINRVDGKLVGDVDFASVEPIAGFITPVPGGVGPMTVATLMHNVVIAAANLAKMTKS
jgi:methylenetetrahydrofolate dehydrogenase (NADP+)/methenyltetrahydrofolate cyclohydrolase